MACKHHTQSVCDSVSNQTTQSIDDCSLFTEANAVPSTFHIADIKCCKSADEQNNLHVTDSPVANKIEHDSRDESTSICLVSHCLAQYISSLNMEHKNHVQSRLFSSTVSWISQVFR